MKKLTILAVIAIATMFASCTKEDSCKCLYTYDFGGEVWTESETFGATTMATFDNKCSKLQEAQQTDANKALKNEDNAEVEVTCSYKEN